MKHRLIVSIVGSALAFVYSAFAKDSPTSAEQLRSKFESALKTQDTNTVVGLFNWEGVDDYSKGTVIAWITRNATNITSVRLSPLPSNFQAIVGDKQNDWQGDNGRRAKFNVAVLGELDLITPTGVTGQLPYGKKGDSFYIAGLIAYQAPGKSLRVRVLSVPASTFTGSWVYVKSGKEVTVNISDRTNQFRQGWGDYIKSCAVRRTSTDINPRFGSFYFEISEGRENIFRSPEMTNAELITYERKQP